VGADVRLVVQAGLEKEWVIEEDATLVDVADL
jgi:hypothetical protein